MHLFWVMQLFLFQPFKNSSSTMTSLLCYQSEFPCLPSAMQNSHISIIVKSGECSVAWKTIPSDARPGLSSQAHPILSSLSTNRIGPAAEKQRTGAENSFICFHTAVCSEPLISLPSKLILFSNVTAQILSVLWNSLLLQSGLLQCKLTQEHSGDGYLMPLFYTCLPEYICATKILHRSFIQSPATTLIFLFNPHPLVLSYILIAVSYVPSFPAELAL